MRGELESFGVPAERIVLVANPVDVERIREFAARPRRRPGDGRRFLAVGRLVPQKRFDRLIPIVQGLPDGDHLTILGEGPERSRLEEIIDHAQMKERVHSVGFTANPWEWMAGADVLVLPSRTEGLPNTVLEVLGCGTSVIATPECGGIGDIAEAAEPGAVQIVPIERFALAMSDVVERDVVLAPRTLFPARFGKEAATAALTEALMAAPSRAPDRR